MLQAMWGIVRIIPKLHTLYVVLVSIFGPVIFWNISEAFVACITFNSSSNPWVYSFVACPPFGFNSFAVRTISSSYINLWENALMTIYAPCILIQKNSFHFCNFNLNSFPHFSFQLSLSLPTLAIALSVVQWPLNIHLSLSISLIQLFNALICFNESHSPFLSLRPSL